MLDRELDDNWIGSQSDWMPATEGVGQNWKFFQAQAAVNGELVKTLGIPDIRESLTDPG